MQHHNYAPCHTAISVNEFLNKKGIPVVPLSLCNFFLFPKLKFHLKGSHFGTVDNLQMIMTEQLRALSHEDFQHCYWAWEQHLQQCVASQGNYFEGIMCIVVQLLTKNFIAPVSLLYRHTSYSLTNNKADKHFISIVTDYLPFAFNVEILYQLGRGVLQVKSRPHKSSVYTFMFPRGSNPSS